MSLRSRADRAVRWTREAWRRIRAWRRISFTAGGLAFTLGTFVVGFAAMNTGNNLLYLLLGAMLGFIVVSGWLSEQTIRGLTIARHAPHAVSVGQDLHIGYGIRNRKERLPSMAVEIAEASLPGRAFMPHVAAGERARVRSRNTFVRRGVCRLGTVTLSTAFPFGLFRKERDLELPGEVVVWPRTDRPVRAPTPAGGNVPYVGASARGALGHRGEYRSLRSYRPGDDPRDIHWRSSAKLREPVVRAYERDAAKTRWICLDLHGDPDSEATEVAVELAAALAASALRESRPFALVTQKNVIEAGEGPAQLERVLDVLARVDFDPHAPTLQPPLDPSACVVVSLRRPGGFGDLFAVPWDARLGRTE